MQKTVTKQRIYFTFTRQELYERLWSKPVASIYEEFGIDIHQLRSVCRMSKIPRPDAAYWKKKNSGKSPPIKQLPVEDLSAEDTVYFDVRNPDYTPPTDEEAAEYFRKIVRSRAVQKRENERIEFVRDLISKRELYQQTLETYLELRQADIGDELLEFKKMLIWIEHWLKRQVADLSPVYINNDLLDTNLFDEGEPDYDFDPKTWTSSFLDIRDYEQYGLSDD